jgi:hypothetical protein
LVSFFWRWRTDGTVSGDWPLVSHGGYPVVVFALSLFSLYALSGANLIGRLPLLKLGLIVISAIYLFRGLAFVVIMPLFPDNSLAFWLISSGICLTIGILYVVGTVQGWALLSKNSR